MRSITLIFVLFFSVSHLYSQSGVLSVLTLEKNESNEYFISYKVKEGETATVVSEKFGHTIKDLSDYNQYDINTIKKYSKVKIPFSKSMLSDVSESTNAAFVYIVKPQETLYSISKKYFEIGMTQIQKWNKLEDSNIGVGESLIVGYASLPIAQKPEKPSVKDISNQKKTKNKSEELESYSYTETAEKNIDEESELQRYLSLIGENTIKADFHQKIEDEKEEEINYTIKQGIAYTENVELEGGDLFVLHSDALINSEMELFNPMLNTSVKAKVISSLPKELYQENISVVISSSVAEALGAKDDQFRVEMKYITD